MVEKLLFLTLKFPYFLITRKVSWQELTFSDVKVGLNTNEE
jgi:hypothetical protein